MKANRQSLSAKFNTRDILLIVFGAGILALAAINYSMDRTGWITNVVIAGAACVLVTYGLLPATRNKRVDEWPKAYQLFAKLFCIVTVVLLFLQN